MHNRICRASSALAAGLLALLAHPAAAQTACSTSIAYQDSSLVMRQLQAATVGAGFDFCSVPYVNGGPVSTSNPMPVSGFAPGLAYANLSVGSTSSEVALPAGSTIIVYNTGSQPAAVKLGTSSSVAATAIAADQVPAGGALAMSVGSNTFIAAIEAANASGATTLVISGGAGMPTGWGGAGGGTVTLDGTDAGNISASATALGTPADPAYSGSGSGSIIALLKALFTNTTGLATAGNQSTAQASLTTIGTNTSNAANVAGTTSDAAYSGSGNSTLSAALRGIYARLAGTVAVSATIAPTSSSSGAPASCVAASGASSVVCKASAGNLYGAYVTSTSSSQQWLFVFNATSAPTSGSTTTSGIASGNLQDCVPVNAGSGASVSGPEPFTTGIVVALSSTACGTFTAATAGFIHGSFE